MTIRLELPYPPSVNHYYRHVGRKVLISRSGRQYRQAVELLVTLTNPPRPLLGRLAFWVDVFPPDRRKRDIGNLDKCLADAIQHAGLIADDEQIDDLRYTRREVRKEGLVIVTITQLEEPGQ